MTIFEMMFAVFISDMSMTMIGAAPHILENALDNKKKKKGKKRQSKNHGRAEARLLKKEEYVQHHAVHAWNH